MDLKGQLLRAASVIFCGVMLAFGIAACGSSDGGTGLPPLKPGGTALKAGKYKATKFRPPISFKVGKGWETASTEVSDYFDIVRLSTGFTANTDFKAIAFERVIRVAPPQAPTSAVPAPQDLVGWIRAHPRLATGSPKQTTVDGLPATQVDARVKSAPPRRLQPTSCDRPCLALFHPSDGRPVSYEPGDTLRFLIVKVGSSQVTITIAARAPSFDRFAPEAEQVVSTVKFRKG